MILRRPLSRRRFLAVTAASTAISAVGGIARPYLSRAADRPVITHGIQSGDVTQDSAVVWARADRPARMLAEIATSDSFKTIHRAVFVDALPETDFTANALIDGLPAGQDIFYRIRFQDLASPTITGEQMTGRFRSAPADRRSVSFVWSGDTAGQGWGIDESRGGMRTYATMLRNRPDFFIHSGDNIYADGPIVAEVKLPDGHDLEEPGDRGQGQAGRDARRVPRQLQIQSHGQERARLQCRGADLLAVGRSRGHQQLVAGRAADPRRACAQEIRRSQRTAAGGAGEPRVPRIHADALHAGRAGARLPQDLLRTAARHLHARHAQLSRPERRRPGGELWAGGVLPRPDPDGVAQARVDDVAGDLEGDRRRHADRPRRGL